MTSEILLGVDIGTTDSKVLATTRDGQEVCLASGRTPWTSRSARLTQTDADAVVASLVQLMVEATDAARGRLGAVRVSGIAVTGMAEIGVLVDDDGRPAHPAIAWFDPRGEAEINSTPLAFREEFAGRTGLPVNSLCSLAKLLWLRGQGVSAAGRRWLNLPEFLVHRLGGAQGSERSLISRTGLIDQDGPVVWEAALDLLDADRSLVGPVVSAGTPMGRVVAGRAPSALVGAVLTVAGHDHPVAAVGCGVTGTDELFDSFGTADALVRSTSTMPPPAARARLADHGINAVQHVLAGQAVLLGGTKAGLLLRRTLELLDATSGERRDALDATAVAASSVGSVRADHAGSSVGSENPNGSKGLAVTGAANNDGVLRITVLGDGFGPAALWQAALDNGALEADRLLDTMAEFAGPVRRTVVAGGWIRMASVRAAKAAALPGVEFSQRRQAGAFGAAVFAGHAAEFADSMTATGDPSAVGIDKPSGPDGTYITAFVQQAARVSESTPVGNQAAWADTITHELEITA
jgi:sugar (pentulose or hexulose) kinase